MKTKLLLEIAITMLRARLKQTLVAVAAAVMVGSAFTVTVKLLEVAEHPFASV